MIQHEIIHMRMRNLRVSGPPLGSFEDVLRWLGAVQSQDYPGGKWGLAGRTTDLTDAAVAQAYADGKLLRTHVLRPTWHFVLPSDIRWMQQLLAPRVQALNAYYYRQAGLSSADMTHSQKLLERMLRGGKHLKRTQVEDGLRAADFEARGVRLAYVLMHAELNAIICSGSPRGKQHTYALLDERVGATPELSRDEALAELTRRYFTSHGPATINDFHWWSSLSTAEIKRGLDMLGSELERRTVDRATFWWNPGTAGMEELRAARAYLLQGYDELFVGYSGESKALLDVTQAAALHSTNPGAFTHVVMVDGQVAGRWRRVLSKTSVTVEVDMFRAPDDGILEALPHAAADYGRYMDLPAELRLT